MTEAQTFLIARIRERLGDIDRSPVWLSRVLAVDLSLVSRWLSGEKPIPDPRVREIAIALHRPVSWFLQSQPAAAAIGPEGLESTEPAAAA